MVLLWFRFWRFFCGSGFDSSFCVFLCPRKKFLIYWVPGCFVRLTIWSGSEVPLSKRWKIDFVKVSAPRRKLDLVSVKPSNELPNGRYTCIVLNRIWMMWWERDAAFGKHGVVKIFMFLKLIDGIESRDEQIMPQKGKRKRKEGNEGGEGYIFFL